MSYTKIIPKTEKDFEWVKWSAKDIARIGKEYVAQVKIDFEKIKAIPKKDRTFENTVYSFERAGHLGFETEPFFF